MRAWPAALSEGLSRAAPESDRTACTCTMKTLLTSTVILALGAAALAAQEPSAAASSLPPGSTGKATVALRMEVLPSATVVFSRAGRPAASGASIESGPIVVQAGQPGELLVEVWKRRAGTPVRGDERELVLAAPLRLERDSTGRASGRVPPTMATALEAASARPSAYTVVVVY